ncbi:hypothetical protein [Seinonella peptonophila]|uniref:hypothetical protein n=1 Tax=Seinonella peptonophila TaxID=112248 RepID=UPI001114B1A5|nr:hypothetical protein [Seinonella peptonophila]
MITQIQLPLDGKHVIDECYVGLTPTHGTSYLVNRAMLLDPATHCAKLCMFPIYGWMAGEMQPSAWLIKLFSPLNQLVKLFTRSPLQYLQGVWMTPDQIHILVRTKNGLIIEPRHHGDKPVKSDNEG